MPDRVIAYERDAMQGKPMPRNISKPIDKMCFLALTYLHRLYRSGAATKDEAAAQKNQMLAILDEAAREAEVKDAVIRDVALAHRDTEAALTAYRKGDWSDASDLTVNRLCELLETIDYALNPRWKPLEAVNSALGGKGINNTAKA